MSTQKPPTDGVLSKIEALKKSLINTVSLLEAQKLVATIKSVKAYAASIKAGQELLSEIEMLCARAERRLGEILIKTPKNRGGNPKLTPTKKEAVTTLKELGIDCKESSRLQALAKMTGAEFEMMLADKAASEVKKKATRNKRAAKLNPDREICVVLGPIMSRITRAELQQIMEIISRNQVKIPDVLSEANKREPPDLVLSVMLPESLPPY